MKKALIWTGFYLIGMLVGYNLLPNCVGDTRPYIKIVLQDKEVMVSDHPFLSTDGAVRGMITIDGIPVRTVDVSNVMFEIDSTGSFYGGPASVTNSVIKYD